MNGADQSVIYEFSGFRLDPGRRRLLSADGRSIPLTSRVFSTLLYLVEHRGVLVDKGTLMQAVWPDTVVEENNLSQETRPEAESEPPVLQAQQPLPSPHLHGRRNAPVLFGLLVLVMAVIYFYLSQQETGPVQEQPVTTTTPPVTEPEKSVTLVPASLQSVAVLPFVNMSPDKDQEYFSDGVAEEVLNQLSRIHDLFVVGRTSSFSFKGKNEDLRVIGEKLGVSHILEGSVRKEGNRVRVSAQLVKAADGYHMWSRSYDRDLGDIFTIQDDIARSVADALQITLGVGELGQAPGMTRNIEAYDAYLSGRSLSNAIGNESTSLAIEQLEHAVTLDPSFAVAWGELAFNYGTVARAIVSEHADEFLSKHEAAATRALNLAPESIVSLRAAAAIRVTHRDWSAAERLLKQAYESAPGNYETNFGYGIFLLFVGRPSDALVCFERAGRIEPLFPRPILNIGLAYQLKRDFASALTTYDRGEQLPGDHGMFNSGRLVVAMAQHDHDMIKSIIEKPDNNGALPMDRMSIMTRSLPDEPGQARLVLHNLFEDPAYNNPLIRSIVALWATYYGDNDFALKEFKEAIKSKTFLNFFIWNPPLTEMRRLPGFKDLVRDLKLVDYWRATGNWGEFCRPVGEDDFECE